MSPNNTRSQTPMPKVTAHLSISLDGYVAGPHQTGEEPLGVLGEELHLWHLGQTDNDVDRAMTARILAPRGAGGATPPSRPRRRTKNAGARGGPARPPPRGGPSAGGRNMPPPGRGGGAAAGGGGVGGGGGGEAPPYHAPVFVLTHYPHDPV